MIRTGLARPTTLAHAIAGHLRDAIQTGVYAPGGALRQEEIASRLGVSRIPIREAFLLLEAEGLVAVHANRGAFVRGHEPAEIEELFDLRLVLESELLRRAVDVAQPSHTAALDALNDRLASVKEPNRWVELDEEFHFTIYALAGRPRTLELARTLRRSLNAYYVRFLTPKARDREWYEEHAAIIRALRKRDGNRALRALAAHLTGTRAALLNALGPGKPKDNSHG